MGPNLPFSVGLMFVKLHRAPGQLGGFLALYQRRFEARRHVSVVPDRQHLDKLQLTLVPRLAKKSRIAIAPETGGAPGGIRLASAAYIGSNASKLGSLIAASHWALSFVIGRPTHGR